ncbi:bb3-type cytochrome oxidase subunit III [Aquincola sp. S2]|uniref:Bb3-type cytochrome oxidase subunit III n=1 Tax=Pseudaquabacterium terrae TaxID=2732868 RepID=A0ABX2EI58_9BURK|nr:bb3-type cytochrome oxidase subunit III [Aquabacterium terrae]NRF68327.1 bb3-type cytochrome oxidase subunit III [Aquabacterium terrae]
MSTAVIEPQELQAPPVPPLQAAGIGLWVFIGVASTLFGLFLAAYMMRMVSPDWSSIAMPGQLWLSTGLLIGGSLLMQAAAGSARRDEAARTTALLWAGGLCAMAFLGAQLWAWSVLQSARVTLTGNPAASFFYVLTALHGLHVLGGLIAWSLATRDIGPPKLAPGAAPDRRVLAERAAAAAVRIHLCARYWHFLLAVWLLLYAALGTLTPEFVRYICGIEAPR